MDRVSLPFNQDPGWNYDQYMGQEVQTTRGEAFDASKQLAEQDTPTMIAARYTARQDLDRLGAKKLSPEEANSQYPVPEKYTEPVSPHLAQYNFDQEQEKQRLQSVVDRGPTDWWTQTRNFGAGLIAHAMDPVEFGATWVTGLATGATLARTAFGARLAAGKAAGTIAGRVAAEGVEAFAGNAIQNTGLGAASYGANKAEGQDVSIGQTLRESATNALFGTMLHLGIKEGVHLADRGTAAGQRVWRNLMGKAPEMDVAVLRHGVSAVDRGANPDLGPMVDAVARQTDVRPEDFPGKFAYDYAPATREDIGARKFYMAAETADPASARQIGDEIGIGRQMTDHPGVANAASEGAVLQVDGAKLNPVVLNEPVSADLAPTYARALEGVVEKPDEFLANATHKDVFDALWEKVDSGERPTSAILDLQEELKAKGYNALLDDGKSVLGRDHQPHNLVTLLEDGAAETKGHFATDPEVRNNPDPDVVDRVMHQNMDEGPHVPDDYQPGVPEPEPDPTAHVDQDVKDALEQADLLDKQGLLDEDMKKDYDLLRGMSAEHETEWTALKAIASCMRGL